MAGLSLFEPYERSFLQKSPFIATFPGHSPNPPPAAIAVKVINHLGDEVMKVFPISR